MAHATSIRNVPGFRVRRWRRALGWVVAAALLGGGCTTLKTEQLPPEVLQAQIRGGSLVQAGDEVTIVTRDGSERTFTVAAVEADAIVGTRDGGAGITVPIDDVLALRTREVDVLRSVWAGVGVSVLVASVLAAAVWGKAWGKVFD